MDRQPEHLLCRAYLDDATGVHDCDLGDEAAHDGEVMAHVDRCYAIGPAHRPHCFEHVPLRRNVETGRRLVENNQCRATGKRHGECHPLLLAARELMRVPLQHFGRGIELRLPQYLCHACFEIVDNAMVYTKGFPQLEPDTKRWVERGRGVLGNVGNPGPTQSSQLTGFELEKVLTVEANLSRRDIETSPGVPEEGKGYGRLARAGLADETEELRGAYGEGHVTYDLRTGRCELNPEVLDLESHRAGAGKVLYVP